MCDEKRTRIARRVAHGATPTPSRKTETDSLYGGAARSCPPRCNGRAGDVLRAGRGNSKRLSAGGTLNSHVAPSIRGRHGNGDSAPLTHHKPPSACRMSRNLAELTSAHDWASASAYLDTLPHGSPRLADTHHSWTALHHAASAAATPALLRALLARGARAEARGPSGSTPLHLAAWHGTAAVAQLVAGGAQVGARTDAGRTPLHFAARKGHAAAARALLQARCADEEDDGGSTARDVAVECGQEEVVAVIDEMMAAGEGHEGEAEEKGEEEENRKTGIGEGVTKRVRSLVETVGTDVVVAGGVGFLLGALVPRNK